MNTIDYLNEENYSKLNELFNALEERNNFLISEPTINVELDAYKKEVKKQINKIMGKIDF